MTNKEIADIFGNVADLLQVKGEIIHRVLSYRRVSESILEQPRDLAALHAEGKLTDIPGVGKTLEEKIVEILDTGKLAFYERLKDEVPVTILDIMRINGVGPKKAKLFWDELDITTLAELKEAAENQKLRELSGMGAKSEQKILDGIEALARQTGRTPLGDALPAAQAILDTLLALPQSMKGEIAGSIRRGRPTIGDVDILIASDDAAPIMDTFVAMEQVARVLGHGPTKSSIELHSGLQVDVRVLPEARYGTALQYFSGSQQHNIRLRNLALEAGYSLNEHALTPVDDNGELLEDAAVTCATEETVYETIGLPWIPPEIREDWGEIEAAQKDDLPTLITVEDIRADLHMHTTYSDGKASIREMAEAARDRGREYIVITDHSRSLGVANGLSIERLMEQQARVREVDEAMGDDFRVFHGTEMEINADGGLDYPDDVLEKLDFVIASLHVSLQQERDVITKRLINAVRNPHVDLIAHPRGQMIPNREGANLDMDAVFEAAAASGIALEINANPRRLDLEAQLARRAQELGILICIDTDAHAIDQMDLLHYGVRTARRGWVRPESVINTWPVARFVEWIGSRGK